MTTSELSQASYAVLDPFTLEIVADGLVSVSDEMFITTLRTSQSPIIYEVLDFSVGLTDAHGRLVSQGNGATVFLGTLDQAVLSVLEKFGTENLVPGDLLATNDPYGGGGTHLSDITVVAPIFFEGALRAFAVNKAHWMEVGGKDPGSLSIDATEIYQEGIQLPCIKIVAGGTPVQSIWDVIEANVRLPTMSIGDLHSQIASVRLATERVQELCAKYSAESVAAATDYVIDRARDAAAHEVGRLPDGTYEAEDQIDGDAMGNPPIRIRVRVTIEGEKMVCDFTGSDAASDRSMNCSRTSLVCGVRTIFKAIVGPGVPTNAGAFEPLDVVCPDGTVFTAIRPAPTSVYWEVNGAISDLVWKALAEVLPDRLAAGHYSTAGFWLMVGAHPETNETFFMSEINSGGWGACEGHDGERALVALLDGETYIMPVEVLEQRFGVMVEESAFNVIPGGAGAGKWRGGEGTVRVYRVLSDEVSVTGFLVRHGEPAWGAAGGQKGSTNAIEFLTEEGDLIQSAGLIPRMRMTRGQRIRVHTGYGGGWGNAMERDPRLVQEDVRNGFVTLADAKLIYGVDIDPNTLEVTGQTSGRRDARL